MSDIAIHVENLSKQYRLGQFVSYKTLRESLTRALYRPFRRLSPEKERSLNDYIWALKGVSLEVKQGEVVGIIGSNGSGKSTLLKILSRITTPTEGHAEIRGRVGSLLEVGTGFNPELSGRENVYLNGAVLGMKRDEIRRRFDEIVEFSGVERFLDTPIKRYSSGMFVRLAFAVAAHLDPEVLLVDEVLAVGDASFQERCLDKMGNVAHEGRTVLFVSHNMVSIRKLCPRCILLKQGLKELDSDTSEVLGSYLGTSCVTSCEVVWHGEERPGNRSVRLNSVALRNRDGYTTPSIEISKGAFVEIEFEVLEEGAQAGWSLVLFDSDANWVFSSLGNIERSYYGKPMQRGRYITTCSLPGDLLNSGTFSVSIGGFGANFTDGFRVDHALSFTAIDDGFLRGDYDGGYLGSIRPRLEWNTRRFEF